MNASPTRKVKPALSLNFEDPMFKGKLNGHTHMGMPGGQPPHCAVRSLPPRDPAQFAERHACSLSAEPTRPEWVNLSRR